MKKISNSSVANAALAVMLCGGNVFAQGGKDSTSNVIVTNTAAQPVPVTVTNAPQSSVTVNNTSAKPIPVKDQGDIGTQPVNYKFDYTIPSGQTTVHHSIVVPPGKRLVIDSLSGDAHAQFAGQSMLYTVLTMCNVQTLAQSRTYLVLSPLKAHFFGTQTTKICADPGSNPGFTLTRFVDQFASDGIATGTLYVTGHFVDVP